MLQLSRGDPECRAFRVNISISLECSPEWDEIIRRVFLAVWLSLGALLAALNLS